MIDLVLFSMSLIDCGAFIQALRGDPGCSLKSSSLSQAALEVFRRHILIQYF